MTQSDKTTEIKIKKSKYERVLSLSSDELIARAIQDVLKREKENDKFSKNRKK